MTYQAAIKRQDKLYSWEIYEFLNAYWVVVRIIVKTACTNTVKIVVSKITECKIVIMKKGVFCVYYEAFF